MENMTVTRRINGASVRALREAIGIRHSELAARVGITRGSLTHVEQGSRPVSAEALRKFADSLGVSIEAISYPVPATVNVAAVAA